MLGPKRRDRALDHLERELVVCRVPDSVNLFLDGDPHLVIIIVIIITILATAIARASASRRGPRRRLGQGLKLGRERRRARVRKMLLLERPDPARDRPLDGVDVADGDLGARGDGGHSDNLGPARTALPVGARPLGTVVTEFHAVGQAPVIDERCEPVQARAKGVEPHAQQREQHVVARPRAQRRGGSGRFSRLARVVAAAAGLSKHLVKDLAGVVGDAVLLDASLFLGAQHSERPRVQQGKPLSERRPLLVGGIARHPGNVPRNSRVQQQLSILLAAVRRPIVGFAVFVVIVIAPAIIIPAAALTAFGTFVLFGDLKKRLFDKQHRAGRNVAPRKHPAPATDVARPNFDTAARDRREIVRRHSVMQRGEPPAQCSPREAALGELRKVHSLSTPGSLSAQLSAGDPPPEGWELLLFVSRCLTSSTCLWTCLVFSH
mmetsp:Transcript_4632/g.10226  ORF Transcript_4632/g.10226 Transcript_4632/m.10226 type:complete len:435 (+) Transcript_4632:391-1695(+)